MDEEVAAFFSSVCDFSKACRKNIFTQCKMQQIQKYRFFVSYQTFWKKSEGLTLFCVLVQKGIHRFFKKWTTHLIITPSLISNLLAKLSLTVNHWLLQILIFSTQLLHCRCFSMLLPFCRYPQFWTWSTLHVLIFPPILSECYTNDVTLFFYE